MLPITVMRCFALVSEEDACRGLRHNGLLHSPSLSSLQYLSEPDRTQPPKPESGQVLTLCVLCMRSKISYSHSLPWYSSAIPCFRCFPHFVLPLYFHYLKASFNLPCWIHSLMNLAPRSTRSSTRREDGGVGGNGAFWKVPDCCLKALFDEKNLNF